MLIDRVAAALRERKVPFAIVGGYAVALHGAVRGTVDLDIVLRFRKADFIAAEQALKSLGLTPRLPVKADEVFEFREEYLKNRNLIAWTFVNPSNPTEIVDVILSHDLEKLKIKHIGPSGQTLPVLAVDDLIKMKRASGRPQDLADVKALEDLRP